MSLSFLFARRKARQDGEAPLGVSSQQGPAGFDLLDEEMRATPRQVVALTVQLARAMGIAEADLKGIQLGAFLHDIGMAAIPDDVLFKPGPLTQAERSVLRRHPSYAYELLAGAPALSTAVDIPYCHHEKWDGTGYPRGLRGEEIPLAARIFAVVDVWVALRSDRPYRPAWSEVDAHVYVLQRAGRDFDPAVVQAFIQMQPEPEPE